MPKRTKRNKRNKRTGRQIFLPLLTMAAVFIGTGSVATVSPAGAPPTSGDSLKDFCSAYWGTLVDGDHYCRFSQLVHLNLSRKGAASVITGIPVMAGDRLLLEASVPPTVVVGNAVYAKSREEILVGENGMLEFHPAEGKKNFAVERLSLERCFTRKDDHVEAAICPAASSTTASISP